jgi:phage terminase small subunit
MMIEDRTMPPLNNTRHERFAQALFEGHTADESYALAGYKPNDGNCIRLKGNERVKARLAELQAAVAKKSEVTVASLLDELEHARSRADGLDQLSAAVKAISEKAKISGLLVQKIEVGGPDAFSEAETIEDIIEAACEQLTAEGYSLDEAEKAQLTAMLLRQEDERQEFLASCKAKLVAVKYRHDPVELRHRQNKERQRQLERQGQRLLTNGG